MSVLESKYLDAYLEAHSRFWRMGWQAARLGRSIHSMPEAELEEIREWLCGHAAGSWR